MSDIKTIWVVEEGDYSDYRVVGVFSSEANAKQIAELVGGDVAEWPIDPNIAELNQGLHVYLVQMRKDGTVERHERMKNNGAYLTSIGVSIWRRSQAPAYSRDDSRLNERLRVGQRQRPRDQDSERAPRRMDCVR